MSLAAPYKTSEEQKHQFIVVFNAKEHKFSNYHFFIRLSLLYFQENYVFVNFSSEQNQHLKRKRLFYSKSVKHCVKQFTQTETLYI